MGNRDLNNIDIVAMVREALCISQNKLAKLITRSQTENDEPDKSSISQSSISQFESRQWQLDEKYRKIVAEQLYLEPGFVIDKDFEPDKGIPFVKAGNGVIRLFLKQTEAGEIDFRLVQILAGAKQATHFILLHPNPESGIESRNRLLDKKHDPYVFYALLTKVQENLILFRRANKNVMFGDCRKWINTLQSWTEGTPGVAIGRYQMDAVATTTLHLSTSIKNRQMFNDFIDKEDLWQAFLSKVRTLSRFDDHAWEILPDRGFRNGYCSGFWNLSVSKFAVELNRIWKSLQSYQASTFICGRPPRSDKSAFPASFVIDLNRFM